MSRTYDYNFLIVILPIQYKVSSFTKENQKGKPFPKDEKLDEDDYKIFKIQERKFFCALIEELNAKLPLYANKEVNTQQENSSDDLPF